MCNDIIIICTEINFSDLNKTYNPVFYIIFIVSFLEIFK